MVINSSQVLISELEFRSHSGDLAPLLYYYKQKPCTLQGCKIDNSLTNICRWCTEMCVFWPKAAVLPCFPAEHSANAVIHSPYELLVPLIPLKNCFHTSIAARLILPENFISQSGMLRWPVQLRIHLSNVRKFDRIAFYLRTVFLDKVLSAFRVYQQAGNAFFAIDRSSLFHQKLRIIFLNAPIISNGNVAHTLSLCVRALVAAVSRDLATQKIMIIRFCIRVYNTFYFCIQFQPLQFCIFSYFSPHFSLYKTAISLRRVAQRQSTVGLNSPSIFICCSFLWVKTELPKATYI